METLMFMVSRTAVSRISATKSKEKEYLGPTPRADLATVLMDTEDQAVAIVIDTPEEARCLQAIIDAVNSPKARLVLAARLFGPPRVSLDWKDRCQLMRTLHRIPRLTQITFQGTTMGQVLSCDLLSRGFPPSLESLTVNAGLILDDSEGVWKLAKALRQLPHLRELRLLNFLNHVRAPLAADSGRLLDPILMAVAECCQSLDTLELSCLASSMEWNEPFLSTTSLTTLLGKCSSLTRLELTHLNLSDVELESIADHRSSRLSRLVLNANENSSRGLARIIFVSCRIGSTITHLECINHVKLTEDMYDYLVWYTSLRHANCPLRHFQATLPLRLDPSLLQRQIRLQNLDLVTHYYAPHISATMASEVLSRVADDPTCLFRLLLERPTIIIPGGFGQDYTPARPGLKLLARATSSSLTRNVTAAKTLHTIRIKKPFVLCLALTIFTFLLVIFVMERQNI